MVNGAGCYECIYVEMKFLRAAAGYMMEDRRRNTEIREELNVKDVNTTIRNYRQQWKDHLQRMSHERIPKIIHRYRPRGYRDVGRPRTRWNDQD